MKLFQFWHDDPPDDVLALMEAARIGQPGFDYVRFDDRSGRAFVAAHYGAREVAVWDACALPAMRSDFLRLLLMDTHGGVYADATYRFIRDLGPFVATAPIAQMPLWLAFVNNNYLMFREPGNLFVRACIALLMENVERRRMGSVLMAAGPGVLNTVRCIVSPEDRGPISFFAYASETWISDGWEESLAAAERLIEPTVALIAAYRSITLVPSADLHEHASSVLDVSHRHRPDHWLRWQGDIYR